MVLRWRAGRWLEALDAPADREEASGRAVVARAQEAPSTPRASGIGSLETTAAHGRDSTGVMEDDAEKDSAESEAALRIERRLSALEAVDRDVRPRERRVETRVGAPAARVRL